MPPRQIHWTRLEVSSYRISSTLQISSSAICPHGDHLYWYLNFDDILYISKILKGNKFSVLYVCNYRGHRAGATLFLREKFLPGSPTLLSGVLLFVSPKKMYWVRLEVSSYLIPCLYGEHQSLSMETWAVAEKLHDNMAVPHGHLP